MSNRRFYAYDPEFGFEMFSKSEDAEAYAQEAIENALDGDTGWHENTGSIEWGELVQSAWAVETNRRPAPEGSDFEYFVDYELHGEMNELDQLRRDLAAARAENAELRADNERMGNLLARGIRTRSKGDVWDENQELRAKLARVGRLPEKWRGIIGMSRYGCIEELDAALADGGEDVKD